MPPIRLSVRILLLSTIFAQLALNEPLSHALAPVTHRQSPPGANFEGDPNHPAEARGWVETKLYFGLGPADAPSGGVSEGHWRNFLDKEVTPRFPSGLTVVNIYGQWQRKPQRGEALRAPSRIRSRLLIVYHPATAENPASIEAIRAAWKQRTGDQSVLKVTQPVDVSF